MPVPKKIKLEQLGSFTSPFYPNKLDARTALRKYTHDENKPMAVLVKALEDTEKQRSDVKATGAAHLFTRDLRQWDNHGLSEAGKFAKANNVPLVTFWVYCLEDLASHSISSFQLQYQLRSLQVLKEDLLRKKIPLYVLNVEHKRDISTSIVEFLKKNNISHLFGNIQYEVDELRLFTDLTRNKDISFHPQHDTCVVIPGKLKTKSKGTQYAVFSPWYKAWIAYLKEEKKDGIAEYKSPEGNDMKKELKHLFEGSKIPSIPKQYKLNDDQQDFFDKYWTFGEHEAKKQVLEFIKSDRIKHYADERNNIETDQTSHVSRHLASGTIAARSIVRLIVENKLVQQLDKGPLGITEWIRQVAWRDFYKHVIVNWPYVVMFKPFSLEYEDLQWEYNREHFERWCEGKTGYPLIDAAMRQLNATGYLHNRTRMVVASFLSKNLLIDWRYGERYFLEHLVDADFASNNGGWGFSSGVGVDPQPYFRIFNPWTQSEKFDKGGDYIRKWVPELKEIEGKAIHNPYEYGAHKVAEKNGYPRPIVDHSQTRERALERYKAVRG